MESSPYIWLKWFLTKQFCWIKRNAQAMKLRGIERNFLRDEIKYLFNKYSRFPDNCNLSDIQPEQRQPCSEYDGQVEILQAMISMPYSWLLNWSRRLSNEECGDFPVYFQYAEYMPYKLCLFTWEMLTPDPKIAVWTPHGRRLAFVFVIIWPLILLESGQVLCYQMSFELISISRARLAIPSTKVLIPILLQSPLAAE